MKQLLFMISLCLCLIHHAQTVETLIQLGHSDRVYCVDLAAAAGLAVTGSMDNTVKLWDMKSSALIRTYHGHHGLVYGVQISADGKFIYSCSWDDQLVLKWDALTGKIVQQYFNAKHPANRIVLSHNARMLACLNEEGVIILNADDFKVIRKISLLEGAQIAFSSDDKQIVIANDAYQQAQIKFFDVNTGILKNEIKGISSPFALQVTDQFVLIGNYEQVKIVNIANGELKYIFKKDSIRIGTASISSQGNLVAIGLENESIILKQTDGNPVKDINGIKINLEKKHSASINALSFSRDGKFLITASNDWTSRVYSLNTGKVVRTFATKSEYIQSLSLSGNGASLAFSSGHLETGNHIGVWDLQRGRLLPWFPNDDPDSYFGSVAFSQRNKTIGAANSNGKLQWYSFPYNGNSGNISFGNAPVTCVTLTPNGKNYIAGTKNGLLLFWRPDRNKSQTVDIAGKSGIAAIAVSPDGSSILAGTYDGKILHYTYEGQQLIRAIETHTASMGYYDTSRVMSYGAVAGMSLDGNFAMQYASVMSVAFNTDNKMMAAAGGSWIKIFDCSNGNLLQCIKQYGAGFSSISFSQDGKTLVAGGADFNVRLFEVSTGKLLKTFSGHQHEVRSVLFSANQKYIISGSLDTQIKWWDIATGKELLNYIILNGGNDYVINNPEGYYFATRGAAGILSFRIGNEIFPFEQFDLKYNRPDIILNSISKIAYNDAPDNPNNLLIKSYFAAYQKRIKRAGFEESQLGATLHVPILTVKSEDIPLSIKEPDIKISFKAEDHLYALKSYNVWVNEVPIFGALGKSISGNNIETSVSIKLSNARNRITISCTNEKGAESYRESFETIYEGGVTLAKTYFIGIGISNYKDTLFNLKYAVKDVNDMASLMKQHQAQVTLLTDQKATKANILELKKVLMQTAVDDKVIISLSGHGLLSKDLDFYYATWDMDFAHPEAHGLLYDDLEALLDGIPARNKLLLVDACHSGEIDKTENIQVADGKPQEGVAGITSRGSAILIDSNSIGLENSFELMQQLFADLSNGSGTTVISAAGGKEYALESAAWNNGVFSYCVMNALKNGAADTNADKKVSVKELKQYVSTQVEQLTGGKQKPTSRKSTTAENWLVN